MMSSTANPPPRVCFVGVRELPDLGTSVPWKVQLVPGVDALRALLATRRFDVFVISNRIPQVSSQLVDELHASGAAVILLVDRCGPDALVEAVELGADAFVDRPLDSGHLARVVAQEVRSDRPLERGREQMNVPRIVGTSEVVRQICETIAYVAPSSAPALITGESGTGKELVALAIHRLSPRRYGPLVSVNCGAIPSNLIESELFGHERGAFTGADARRIGRFELADGGTLFLDEIGELELHLQVRLLRVLQEGRFNRVGGAEPIEVDVRIIAATNRELEQQVRKGSFREDLYYRLNVLHVELPALRDRAQDVRVLWDHFVEVAALEEGCDVIETSDRVFEILERHHWPGNVRELENVARRVVAMRPSRAITPMSLPVELVRPRRDDEIRIPGMTLDELERLAILKTYDATGSVRKAAEILGVSERKIFYRLKQYREEEESEPEDTRPTLALVEDDPDFRAALGQLLGRSYRVVEFASVVELLEHIPLDVPHVIVSDIRMPEFDGFELIEKLRDRRRTIPVILMSAFADDRTRNRAHELGAVAFLEKPVDTIALGRVLERATSRAN